MTYPSLAVFIGLFPFLMKGSYAQAVINVMDGSKEPVTGAIVSVRKSDSLVAKQITDAKGRVMIDEKYGTYTVLVESLFAKKTSFNIQISKDQNTFDLVITHAVNKLDEVVVKGYSVAQGIRESDYSPEVIDLRGLKSTSKTVVESINLASGLRVLQQGGMGSDLNVNLNGIDGKDVKVFVDGIPVYLLGRGFELQNLTVNMVDRIEIYKGLIPVKFGSDALGGVINVVTRADESDFLGLGYSYGSWNSHEANLSVYSHPLKDKKFFGGLDAVYRHADNDYWMDDVDVVVDDTYNTKKGRARRFNDAYDFGLAKLQIGFNGLKWADNIRLISSFTYTDKEWQHGITALKPWGEPFSVEHTGGAALNWIKYGAQKGSWNVDLTAGYHVEQTSLVDTSSHIYFWDGSFVEGRTKGESGLYSQGRTPNIRQNVLYARENTFFRIGHHYRINVNLLVSKRVLTGEDKAGTATYKNDPFKVPQKLANHFFGASLESKFLRGHLIGNTSLKYYYSKIRGASFKINNEFDKMNTSSSSDMGFGQVIKWTLTSKISVIPGYEYTIRQPDGMEIFGDYITINPNPNLKPAKSHNVNFRVNYKSVDEKIFSGIGCFYRRSKNRIMLTSFADALAAYTNLLQTSVIGAEGSLQYKPAYNIGLDVNATYQDIRLRAVDDLGIFTKEYIGARIPNTPYFFANAQGAYTWYPKGNRHCYFRFLYTVSYVHAYFLTWAMNGIKSSKVTIPSQFVNDFSIAVHAKNERWGFAVDGKNLCNARLFDNFSVQKPGRSFYVKLTYLLTKQES